MEQMGATTLKMLIESLMEAGGHREIYIDDLRRAINSIARTIRYRVEKNKERHLADFLFPRDYDALQEIRQLVEGWESEGLLDRYWAGAEIAYFLPGDYEKQVINRLRFALGGMSRETRATLLPIIHQGHNFYDMTVAQRHSCDL